MVAKMLLLSRSLAVRYISFVGVTPKMGMREGEANVLHFCGDPVPDETQEPHGHKDLQPVCSPKNTHDRGDIPVNLSHVNFLEQYSISAGAATLAQKCRARGKSEWHSRNTVLSGRIPRSL